MNDNANANYGDLSDDISVRIPLFIKSMVWIIKALFHK